MKALVALALVGCLGGCGGTLLSAVPSGPVSPADQPRVAPCESTATAHNAGAILGLTLSGSTAVVGIVDTQVPAKTQQVLNWVTIGLGALAAVDTLWTTIESANYAQSQCPTLLGPLPVAGK